MLQDADSSTGWTTPWDNLIHQHNRPLFQQKKKSGVFCPFNEIDQFSNPKCSSAGIRKVLQPRAKGVKETENGKE